MVNKKELRREFRDMRRSMDRHYKIDADKRITQRFLSLDEYKKCDTLLCFVSMDIETDTYAILMKAFEDGKTVFAPKCIAGNEMRFYKITSLDDLYGGAYGISEPHGDTQQFEGGEENALCVVPALCYDKSGYRLGFGMGFYDRFLSKYSDLYTVGLCYEEHIMPTLPHEQYDISVKKIITDVRTIDTEV